MSDDTWLSSKVTAMDNTLPRPITVLRQQSIYWPSVWMSSVRADLHGSFIVCGFPSSGTNWLCQLVSRYFEIPIFEPWKRLSPTLRPHVYHLHRFVDTPAARKRTFYITRDGRDAIVSRYHKLFPNPNDLRPLRAFEAATGLNYDKTKIREQLPKFIDWYFSEKRFSAMNWGEHVRKAVKMDMTMLTFEDLKKDAMATLTPAFERYLEEPVNAARLIEVVDSMEFSKVRNSGTSHHKRKSQVGEWRTVYNQEARKRFAKHAQAELEALGLEHDASWVYEK